VGYEKIILVTRKTRLEGLIQRFNTPAQAKFYLEHNGGDFTQYQQEHDTYYAAVEKLNKDLQPLGKFQAIERSYLPNFLFTEKDIVVAVGIDGLVVNTAKYLNGQPLVAINPDPAHIDGILLPFNVGQAGTIVKQVFQSLFTTRAISMAEVRLNDGQSLLAINDLFIGIRSHISARYLIQQGDLQEHHSSSGIIVSTGIGSTGWLSSIINMANGVMKGFTQMTDTGQALSPLRLDWDEERLVYVVREPFISKTTQAEMVCGFVTSVNPLILHSEMPESGVIFSDGIESDYLAFNAGSIATISVSNRKTNLVISA
jgi:NAD kinase